MSTQSNASPSPRRLRRRATRALAVFALALAAFPAAASAAIETEPNDNPIYANGPLGAGGDGTFEGSVSAGDPRDFLLVNFAPYTQVTVQLGALEAIDSSNGCVKVLVRQLINNTSSSILSITNSTTSEDYSSQSFTSGPAGLRGLIDIRPCSSFGATYKIDVTPPASLLPTPKGSPVYNMNPEPNETRASAAGPLAPFATYVGAIDTQNDADWFQFWVPAGQHQISLQAMEFSGDVKVTWYLGDETRSVAIVNSNDLIWGSRDYTFTGPVKVYGQVTATGYPQQYALRLEPAGAGVTTNLADLVPPPTPVPTPVPAPPAPPAPPADTTAPTVSVTRATYSRGTGKIRVYWTADEPGKYSFSLKSGSRTVSRRSYTVSAAGSYVTTVTLSASSRAVMRSARRRGLRIRFNASFGATDGAGNVSSKAVTIRLS